MPGLTIILTTPEPERLRGALVTATSWAALGEPVTLFLQLDAVSLATPMLTASRDAAHEAAGLPALGALLEMALEAEVAILLCQSGLDLSGVSLGDCDPRMRASGPFAVLAQARDEGRRIIMA